MTAVNLQTKAPTFTPEYFYQTHHKFHSYFEKVQVAMELVKEDDKLVSPNFCWWFDGHYYHVTLWCQRVDEQGKTLSVKDIDLFCTRYQKDALVAVMFFHALYKCSGGWRENWKPGGVSARGGWAYKDEVQTPPPSSSKNPTLERRVTAPPIKFPQTALTVNMNLLEVEDALKDIFGCSLTALHSKTNVIDMYEGWLADLEVTSFSYVENFDDHIDWIEKQAEALNYYEFKKFVYQQALIMKKNFEQ